MGRNRGQQPGDGGRNWIRTSEGVSQQIYSLPPLATWVSYHTTQRGGGLTKPRTRVNPHTLMEGPSAASAVTTFSAHATADAERGRSGATDLWPRYPATARFRFGL